MEQVISNSGHDDMIHDAVLDYYGRRLATCSSDRTIKIFDIEGDTHRLTETLKGHEGAVWCVSWAHPKFGNILASAGYDGKVFIWREQNGQWQKVFDFALHTASVNVVAWSPHEVGCLLACASSDGNVSVLEFDDNRWEHKIFPAHGIGVNAVSWAPALYPSALFSSATRGGSQAPVRRFVTGGSDNLVKIWDWNNESKSYSCTITLPGHTDWVRDVAWSPTVLQKSYIASASQDKTVRIWTCTPSTTTTNLGVSSSSTATHDSSNSDHHHHQQNSEGGGGGGGMTTSSGMTSGGSNTKGGGGNKSAEEWHSTTLTLDAVLWRVSWSLSGNVLAISGGDNKVSLWKENLKGEWECVKTIEE
ncbi:MAG: hypothetical protein M1823_003069 [Watsoniomyces obsoletus]|nr:MAG: hypothetical protein M1823_003069 [Watsoniomyces obsoletus]